MTAGGTYELAVAVVRRRRGRVIDRATIRFKSEEHYKQFTKVLSDYTRLEFYTINIKKASSPDDNAAPKGKLWCPYCSDWGKFFQEGDGYTRCEICTISTRDFYTKKYNVELGLLKREVI